MESLRELLFPDGRFFICKLCKAWLLRFEEWYFDEAQSSQYIMSDSRITCIPCYVCRDTRAITCALCNGNGVGSEKALDGLILTECEGCAGRGTLPCFHPKCCQ